MRAELSPNIFTCDSNGRPVRASSSGRIFIASDIASAKASVSASQTLHAVTVCFELHHIKGDPDKVIIPPERDLLPSGANDASLHTSRDVLAIEPSKHTPTSRVPRRYRQQPWAIFKTCVGHLCRCEAAIDTADRRSPRLLVATHSKQPNSVWAFFNIRPQCSQDSLDLQFLQTLPVEGSGSHEDVSNFSDVAHLEPISSDGT